MAEESDDETYCLCRRAYSDGDFMIQCDICKDWFHGRLVLIKAHHAKATRTEKQFTRTSPSQLLLILTSQLRWSRGAPGWWYWYLPLPQLPARTRTSYTYVDSLLVWKMKIVPFVVVRYVVSTCISCKAMWYTCTVYMHVLHCHLFCGDWLPAVKRRRNWHRHDYSEINDGKKVCTSYTSTTYST